MTQRFAEAIALLVKQPRTRPELRDAMGIGNEDQPARYIKTLRGEGLLYIKEWRRTLGPYAAVYAWQPSVCFHDDAPKPRADPKLGHRLPAHTEAYRALFADFESRYIPHEGSRVSRLILHMRKQGRGAAFKCAQLAAALFASEDAIYSALEKPLRRGLVENVGRCKRAIYRLVWAVGAKSAQVAPESSRPEVTGRPTASCCAAPSCDCARIPCTRDSGTRIALAQVSEGPT